MHFQRGNALFLILIAVALFAALSYAITQSGRGGGSIDKEKAQIYAAQLVQTVANIQHGVQRMVLLGTPTTSISAGATPDAVGAGQGTDNWDGADFCTTGEDCLFAPEGGGVAVPELPQDAFDSRAPGWIGGMSYFAGPHSYHGLHFHAFGNAVAASPGAGTDDNDDMFFAYPLKKEVCEAINRGLGYEGMVDWGAGTAQIQMGCGNSPDPDQYMFWAVIYAH